MRLTTSGLINTVQHNGWKLFILVPAIFYGLFAVQRPALATSVIFVLIAGILTTWLIVKRPYWIILFLVIFTPFETIFLRYLPLPRQIASFAEFTGELLIYFAFAISITRKLLTQGTLRKTPIDFPLILFTLAAFTSIIVNQAPIVSSLLALRSIVRYIFLFYFVVNLNLSQTQVKRLLHWLIFIGIIQIAVGVIQIMTNGAINSFLLPKLGNLEIAGQSRQFRILINSREIGSIFGTLGDTVFYSHFLLVVAAVYLGGIKRLSLTNLVFLGAILVAQGYSFVRSTFFGLLLLFMMFSRVHFGLKRLFLFFLITFPLCIGGLYLVINSATRNNSYNSPVFFEQSIFENITGVFSQRYIEIARTQRLGALIATTPTVLVNRPLLGYGPDTLTTIEKINNSQPSFLLRTLDRRGFEDVYWVALLAYYGLVGVAILTLLLIRLFLTARRVCKITDSPLTKQLALTVMNLVVLTFFLNLFNQSLEYRAYALYFWLFPALMWSLFVQESKASHHHPCRKTE